MITVISWIGYPIVLCVRPPGMSLSAGERRRLIWPPPCLCGFNRALAEVKGKISPDVEVIIFGVLDIVRRAQTPPARAMTFCQLTLRPRGRPSEQFATIVWGMYILIAHSHTEGDTVSPRRRPPPAELGHRN
jgi:hypothetical protein